MSTSKETGKSELTIEDVIYPKLRDPEYAGYFLSSAVEDEEDEPGAIQSALRHVILANAERQVMIPLAAVLLLIEHHTAENFNSLIDLMEETFLPEARTFYADHGTFQDLRQLARMIEEGSTIKFDGLSSTNKAPAPHGMLRASQSLQDALPELSDTYRQMKEALAA